MSRFALLLAILGLVAFALPALSFADGHEVPADVAAPAEADTEDDVAAEEGGDAEEGAAEESGEESPE